MFVKENSTCVQETACVIVCSTIMRIQTHPVTLSHNTHHPPPMPLTITRDPPKKIIPWYLPHIHRLEKTGCNNRLHPQVSILIPHTPLWCHPQLLCSQQKAIRGWFAMCIVFTCDDDVKAIIQACCLETSFYMGSSTTTGNRDRETLGGGM